MAQIVAGILAIIALATGLATGLEPTVCLARGSVAFLAGWIGWSLYIGLSSTVSGKGAASSDAERESEKRAA